MSDTKITLDDVNSAIASILAGGQSYKIGTMSLTRADLSQLYAMKSDLEAAENSQPGIGRATAAAYFGRR